MRRSFGWMLADSPVLDHAAHLQAFARRSTLVRRWQQFMERCPLALRPVSGEPPFPWGLDVESAETMARVLRAQEPQFALPLLGLPGLPVPTGLAGAVPMGVQLTAPRFREDLFQARAEARFQCFPAWVSGRSRLVADAQSWRDERA